MPKNFSPSDVSDVLDTLIKAGLTADQIVGGALSGALQIAACGDIPAWQAGEYAAAAINRAGLNTACQSVGVVAHGDSSAVEAARAAMKEHNWKCGGML